MASCAPARSALITPPMRCAPGRWLALLRCRRCLPHRLARPLLLRCLQPLLLRCLHPLLLLPSPLAPPASHPCHTLLPQGMGDGNLADTYSPGNNSLYGSKGDVKARLGSGSPQRSAADLQAGAEPSPPPPAATQRCSTNSSLPALPAPHDR